MQPVKFPQQNKVMEKPEGWSDDDCMALPVWFGPMPFGPGKETPAFVSCWQLSADDLAAINKNHVLWLSVISNSLPPVSVLADNPFTDGLMPEIVKATLPEVTDLNEIDNTPTGKLLLAAIAHLTTHEYQDKTPYEVIQLLAEKAKLMD